ncbi:hypothetical protein Lepto7375DRAFT_1073 [Leptolyngbya sp. PCC 7375]|nr:hypothetical protein Lepto7375DRAFT_1073 [Leptolyngbya sp. PCC 7375]
MAALEIANNLAKIVSELMIAVKSTNTHWMEENLEAIYRNQKNKEMYELELQRQIQLRKAEINQELNELALEYEGKLERLKMKIEQETRDYTNFLKELDSLKSQIIAVFKDIPPVTALLIHRHASELLNDMWNEPEIEARRVLEAKLLDLFGSVNDDVKTLKSSEDGTYYLPEKTIELIRKR